MADYQKAWVSYKDAISKWPSERPSKSTIRALQLAGRTHSTSLWTLRYLLGKTSTSIPKLLSEACESIANSERIAELVSVAHDEFRHAITTLSDLESCFPQTPSLLHRFSYRLRAHLNSVVNPGFSNAVYKYFAARLLANESAAQPPPRPPFVAQLTDLGFSNLVEDALSWAVFERMDALVASQVSSSARAIPELMHWVERFAAPCVAALLPENCPPSDAALWKKRLEFHLHESVWAIRTDRLLLLIEKFPQSLPALHDLRDCILSTDRKPFVATALRDQFVAKLLNAGTLTSEILQLYVSTIRALRFLDPSGVILACVSDPIRTYLRRRPDTVRCIVSGMTGDGDLHEELQRGRRRKREEIPDDSREVDKDDSSNMPTLLDMSLSDLDDDDCQSIDGDFDIHRRVDDEDYKRWVPDPVDAPVREGKWRPGGDAIATLVNIYGSSEQIVEEYRTVLADKLMSTFEVDLKREERVSELLTERFGKDAMHDCIIMLKDVRDSSVALKAARKEQDGKKGGLDKFETTIISKEFWPVLVDEGEFQATDEVEWQMAQLANSFGKAKAPRKLRWQHGFGVVEIKLEFEDGRQVVTKVSPMQATILSHFARRRKICLTDLAHDMKVRDVSVVRRKVQILASMGFIRVVDTRTEVYETVENASGIENQIEDGHLETEDVIDENETKQEEAEMAVYETYIMAMLQNLKQLSLEQIHGMLQRFVQTPVYDKTQTQLAGFLTGLVAKGKVEVSAGIYKVKK